MWQAVLSVLAAGLVLGMVLFCRNADPIEPGPGQFRATVFLILGGWLGLFLIFHGLSPAAREKKHILRMRAEEGETETYEGAVRCGERPEQIPGSIPVLRVQLTEDPHNRRALIRKSAAGDFPKEGRLRLTIRNGYVAAWQEADA